MSGEFELPSLLKLVAINAYAAYCNAMTNRAPQYAAQFLRTSEPEAGDVVLEVSTVFRSKDAYEPIEGQFASLGILLRKVQEPVVSAERLAEMHAEGDYFKSPEETLDQIPKEVIYYVRPLDGSVPEFRWSNARFIRVLSKLADIHPLDRPPPPNSSTTESET